MSIPYSSAYGGRGEGRRALTGVRLLLGPRKRAFVLVKARPGTGAVAGIGSPVAQSRACGIAARRPFLRGWKSRKI
jgi:hypothetical protein